VGVAVSVSHASEQTTLDVCEVSEAPVLLTHNAAKGVLGVPYSSTDECLETVARTGGVIGIKASPHTTASESHPRHTIESVMDHFEYVVDLVGIDHVTFGLDANYGDHAGMHERLSFGGSVDPPYNWHPDIEKVDYVKGMENPTEGFHNIIRWLVKNEYSDDEIQKVAGGNTLRVMEAAWA
jgi:membrane dipeptidase